MAAGRRRLGPVLTRPTPTDRGLGDVADDRSDVLDALQVLAADPSPRGREPATAHRLQQWAGARWPDLELRVEAVGGGASLVATRGPGPLLYSHLDTSLDGAERDALITGRHDPVGPLRVDGDDVSGFGLTVARAPAAAALVAFAGAARSGTLLLAGSGTHRRGSGTTGLEHHLATHGAPSSAVVAKCGPGGVLWQEPGAAYLTVRVTGSFGVALFPDAAVPPRGLVEHAGPVLDAIAQWRAKYLATAQPQGQVGPACGIGSIRSGWPDKPDLLPAALEVGVYLATVPGADVPGLARDLAAAVEAPPGCRVEVDHEVVHPAAATPPDAPIVAAAHAAWTHEFGPPADITRWAGTTDGVVLRGAGVPTVRLGPQGRAHPTDPRRDVLSLSQLTGFVRIYRTLLDGGSA